ncbi:MAG: hypothetical protein Q4F78_02120 [Bacillota bacterium]|nr:hypothetical protein [Bacillota bacterium]
MEILRKTVKVMMLSFIVFILLTLLSAAIIHLTGIKESLSDEMMLISLSLSAVFAGVLEARILGKKMLYVFLITALLFVFIVYVSLYVIFDIK